MRCRVTHQPGIHLFHATKSRVYSDHSTPHIRLGEPSTSDTEHTSTGTDWQRWMRDLGAQVLRIREFLGFSQEQLARLAGVSQGAISRLENGRGLATPLLVVLKTCGALRAALMHVDQEILSPEARQLVVAGAHIPGEGDLYPSFPPTHDPGVEE